MDDFDVYLIMLIKAGKDVSPMYIQSAKIKDPN